MSLSTRIIATFGVFGIARPKSGWDGFFPVRAADVVLDFELPPSPEQSGA